jgi:hypothetical protein
MGPIELTNRSRLVPDDSLGQEGKSFISNKAIPQNPPKLRIIVPKAFVSMGYEGF